MIWFEDFSTLPLQSVLSFDKRKKGNHWSAFRWIAFSLQMDKMILHSTRCICRADTYAMCLCAAHPIFCAHSIYPNSLHSSRDSDNPYSLVSIESALKREVYLPFCIEFCGFLISKVLSKSKVLRFLIKFVHFVNFEWVYLNYCQYIERTSFFIRFSIRYWIQELSIPMGCVWFVNWFSNRVHKFSCI